MSSPTGPPTSVPAPSLRDSGAAAHADRLSAGLAGACAAVPARWRSLVHHEPGSRWYVPLDDLVLDLAGDGPALDGPSGRGSEAATAVTAEGARMVDIRPEAQTGTDTGPVAIRSA